MFADDNLLADAYVHLNHTFLEELNLHACSSATQRHASAEVHYPWKTLQDNMLMSLHSARSEHQQKIPDPKHSRNKTQISGNNHVNHSEQLTEKVHTARSSLPPRASVKPSPHDTMDKMRMYRTETRSFHCTEVQFKSFLFKWKHTNT